MKKLLTVPFALFLGLMTLIPSFASASEDPVSMLNSVANQMISGLKTHKATLKSNPSVVYSLANRIVVPHANLEAMSQRVLPPQTWKNATPSQRGEFKTQFTRVLERTYASALANYTDETVKFYPVRGGYQGKSSISVNSEIVRPDGPSIRVSYRLLASGGQWKLYDMTVEGVSMLESFRSQFSSQLSKGNIAELIATLKKHNAGM
jgi:phospholipid transport system substrate-binding protein